MKRNSVLFVAIFTFILLLMGGTYALWTWNSSINKNVVFSTAGLEDYINYDEGESYFIGNFQPYSTFCQSVHATLSFSKTNELADKDIYATIYMDVNSIGENISSSTDVHWVITTGDSSITCTDGLYSSGVINSGTFNNVQAGDVITLKSNIEVTTTAQQYTVWIWINSTGSNLSLLSGETVDTNIWTYIDMFE